MRSQLVALALISAALPCAAQKGRLSDWTSLIDHHNCQAAKSLCSEFVDSASLAEKVDVQKCLANVALCGHGAIMVEGDDAGGGVLRDGYEPKAADQALTHLDLALKLAPQDLSIHLGRLHVLEVAGRYDDMVKALDESCSIYKGKDVPDAWLAYAPELEDLGQYKAGVAFMKVLNKHYPNSPDILGNIGAFYSMQGDAADAIPYLKRAVELAPKDPINSWDLGRAYDYANQTALADMWYLKGLSLMSDPDQRKEGDCIYAEFVEKKLHDRTRACAMEKQSCPAKEQTACGTPAPHSDAKTK